MWADLVLRERRMYDLYAFHRAGGGGLVGGYAECYQWRVLAQSSMMGDMKEEWNAGSDGC